MSAVDERDSRYAAAVAAIDAARAAGVPQDIARAAMDAAVLGQSWDQFWTDGHRIELRATLQRGGPSFEGAEELLRAVHAANLITADELVAAVKASA